MKKDVVVDKVICLVGKGPLPVYLSLKTLGVSDVVLVHGDEGSKLSATRLAARLESEDSAFTSRLVEVPAFDPCGVKAALAAAMPDGAGGRHLIYGPGTAPMGVMAYAWWISTAGPEASAWYVAARPSSLRSDLGQTLPLQADDLDVETIAGIHLDHAEPAFSRWTPLHPVPDSSLPLLAQLIEIIATQPKSHKTVSALRSQLSLTAPPTDGLRFLTGVKNQNLIGSVLEFATAVLFDRFWANEGFADHETVLNFEHSPNGSTFHFEVDVVTRLGERLLVASCASGQSRSALRQKFFEASSRSTQLGGSETRSVTVIAPRDDIGLPALTHRRLMNDLRDRLESRRAGDTAPFTANHTIVSIGELFGSQPLKTLQEPASIFKDEHRAQFGEWLRRSSPR
jgi:hypothetical protein